MKSRLALAGAALLCFGVTVAEASVVTWRVDFTAGPTSGYFEVDATNFVIPATAWEPTTFSVIAADISIANPGWLFKPIHYTLNDLETTKCTPAACSLTFGTTVFVPNKGTYHPTLQLNFDRIWVDWVHADQQHIFLRFDSPPQSWNAVGDAQRTVETAVPEPSTWAMLILGFAGLGFMACRRKSKPDLSTA
jgi:hypothetical protein